MSRGRASERNSPSLAPSDRLRVADSPWVLLAEGAAWHEGQRVVVIADVHLGYEWARARLGDVVPAHSLRETTDRLESLLSRVETRVLIVAGDLVESDHTQARRDVRELESWLQSRGVELIRLRGNHDGAEDFVVPSVTVDGWTICHGDRPIDGFPAIVGHLHPCVRLGAHRMRCFLHGPRLIVLPAFSENAAGQEVGSLKVEARCWDPFALRCAVVAGVEIRDFGPWRELAGKLGYRESPGGGF